MKAVALCLIFVAVAFASKEGVQPSISSTAGFTLSEIQQIEELRNTKWGSIYLTMAELQVSVGPIQRLIQALDDTLKELQQSLSAEKSRFSQKKAAHESQVQSLKSQIAAAESEINNNKAKIQNVLIPRQKQAQADIVSAKNTIVKKNQDIESSTQKRKNDHAEFKRKVKDHNAAIGAVDECLSLVGTLQKKPSLVEVKKATLSIRKLELQLRQTHFTETPLIEALITLVTNQNFAKQDSVNKVLSLLGDFRKKLVGSLNLEKSNEAASKAAFVKLIAQLNKEIDELQKSIVKNTNLITETDKAIDDCRNIILVKSHEEIILKQALEDENEVWRKEVVTHKEIVAEMNKEISVIKDCRTLFAKANFGSYVKGKMGK